MSKPILPARHTWVRCVSPLERRARCVVAVRRKLTLRGGDPVGGRRSRPLPCRSACGATPGSVRHWRRGSGIAHPVCHPCLKAGEDAQVGLSLLARTVERLDMRRDGMVGLHQSHHVHEHTLANGQPAPAVDAAVRHLLEVGLHVGRVAAQRSDLNGSSTRIRASSTVLEMPTNSM